MNLMVNPTITGFRQDVDGTIKELKLGEAKEDAFANIIEQGGADLDDNKAATINVSTYTQPVEITPTSGKDGMKKATVTLSHIPQIESNKAQSINVSTYTDAVEIEPTSPNDAMAKVTVTLSNIPSGSDTAYGWWANDEEVIGFSFSVAPSTFALYKQERMVSIDVNQNIISSCDKVNVTGYEKISDTEFVVTVGEGATEATITYTRDNTKDFSVWDLQPAT